MNKIIFQICKILLTGIFLIAASFHYCLVYKQGFSFENMKKKLVPYQIGVMSKTFLPINGVLKATPKHISWYYSKIWGV